MKKRMISLLTCVITAAALVCIPIGEINSEKVHAYYNSEDRYEYIKNGDFEDGVGDPWKLRTGWNASAESEITDGAYKVTIKNIKDKKMDTRWDVNLYYRNLTLTSGDYDVSFTVTADRDSKIYPTIGKEYDDYTEYWNCQSTIEDRSGMWYPIELHAGESKTIKGSFRMDKTVEHCQFAFFLAGDCAPEDYVINSGDEYSYTFSNVRLTKRHFNY